MFYGSRMADEFRICSRAGCSHPAHASLSFRYGTRQVWVRTLTTEPEASWYDLCGPHADALTVPQGWHRIDERGQKTGKPRRPRATRRPAVSARAAAPVSTPSAAPPPAKPSAALPGCAAPRGSRDRYAALRAELPRLAAEIATATLTDPGAPSADGAPSTDGTPSADGARGAEVEGQLAIPVEPGGDGAVVVSINQLANARRRSGQREAASHLSPQPAGS